MQLMRRASAWARADIRVASAAARNRSPACTAAIASATLGNAGPGSILTSLRAVAPTFPRRTRRIADFIEIVNDGNNVTLVAGARDGAAGNAASRP